MSTNTCIRINAVMVKPDIGLAGNRLFKTNEIFCVDGTIIKEEGCGCNGTPKVSRMYYVVTADGKTYHLDADLVRPVACEGPPEEVTGRPEDYSNQVAEANPGFEVKDEVRNDKYWMHKFNNVVFDLRTPAERLKDGEG